MSIDMEFEKELKILINKYSVENESNTPDFILARYIMACLNAFATTTQQRESWHGRNPRSSYINFGLKNTHKIKENSDAR